jgi:proteic killer suppression protein
MIRKFADRDTYRIFRREPVQRFQSFERSAFRKIRLLHGIAALSDLKGPGLSFEALKATINDRWRICFVWKDGDAYDVEIVDYH